MSYNIIDEYINFLRKSYLELFKIIFGDKYRKDISSKFINKYIDVRYFNETNYSQTKDFMKRINNEFIDLVKKLETNDNIEELKNIVALFGYLVYFDDINYVVEDAELIDSLVNDDIVKMDNKKGIKKQTKDWYRELNNKKDSFNKAITTSDFEIIEKRLYRKLFYLSLEYNVKISNLYSEYAIDKAYNSGIVNEDKLFVTYILASSLVLNNAINLDFSRYYLVPIASTLFEKEKKFMRLINVINNPLSKKFISIKILYSDYKKNKSKINNLINDGYSFGIELDEKYTGNTSELVLFPYIFVNEDSPEYEMLMREKERLKSKIIKL
jgi:hypothetical protein